MAAQEESLESLLTKATNPLQNEEDWDMILAFCDQINKELEGPQIAVRLLCHKIQSPQEREALYSLSALESCVKNCGRRFHQEIGKFRFLNEIIKVVSPKYLGNHTTEKVKKKCIELLYSWSEGLPNEGKIHEAYQMLKRQGIVKVDPTYVDQTLEPPPPPRPGNTIFDDDDKSKLLSRLLKSKHPEDLQAANRLIKNMVKQDAERMEKVSKRVQQIETVNNNIKVLSEMITHYRPGSASDAEKDLMKELYENLEKARPNLFRLASDTDEKDNEGIDEILKANDEVLSMMNLYKKTVGGTDYVCSSTTEAAQSHASGLIDMQEQKQGPSVMSQLNKNDLDMLNDIFTSSSSTLTSSSGSADIGILNLSTPEPTPTVPVLPPPLAPPPVGAAVPGAVTNINWNTRATTTIPAMVQAPLVPNNTVPSPAPGPAPSTGKLDALNELGQSLMQQSLSTVPAASIPTPVIPTLSLTLNQIAAKPATVTAPLSSTTVSASPIPTPPSGTGSPARGIHKPSDILPLTDLSVPLESIQPGDRAPVTAYDKNNIKAILHLGKSRPRPDVSVMVLSVMSTNTSAIKTFSFQAAVPKIMKVKLQPPSATDLPAYNPILPPTAITQVMLIANPLKEKIRLKFKISFTQDNKQVTDIGDVEAFSPQ